MVGTRGSDKGVRMIHFGNSWSWMKSRSGRGEPARSNAGRRHPNKKTPQQAVVGKKMQNGEARHFIKWKGYASSKNTREPFENIADFCDLVSAFAAVSGEEGAEETGGGGGARGGQDQEPDEGGGAGEGGGWG
ncbi:hypothetical protein T484DRAFT_3098540 [Baffinella frigidus]|nr:hypothetical protein T484DRAFT_3098540 [Cryptophyta sp. CCMP2293]